MKLGIWLFFGLTLTTVGLSAGAQSAISAIPGAWADYDARPVEVLFIVEAGDALKITLLPGSQLQTPRTLTLRPLDGYFIFENDTESYWLYPHLEEGAIDLEHGYANVSDPSKEYL